MMMMGDNLYVAYELSSLEPCYQWNNPQPFGYSQRHTLAHVAADHEAVNYNQLIPNGTTDHT